MIDVNKFSKLGVGDIADYARYQKEELKKELIATMKDIYGDNLPDNAFSAIEDQLKKMPSLMNTGDIDAAGLQYLLWISLRKKDNSITLKQVGDEFDLGKADEYVKNLFPSNMPEKKRPRSPVKKKKKKTNR